LQILYAATAINQTAAKLSVIVRKKLSQEGGDFAVIAEILGRLQFLRLCAR
jgi:hypothetical protein